MGWWEMTNTKFGGIDLDKALRRSQGKKVAPNTGLVMGDGPADIMGAALHKIVRQYKRDWGREPTRREIKACFNFCFGGISDDLKP